MGTTAGCLPSLPQPQVSTYAAAPPIAAPAAGSADKRFQPIKPCLTNFSAMASPPRSEVRDPASWQEARGDSSDKPQHKLECSATVCIMAFLHSSQGTYPSGVGLGATALKSAVPPTQMSAGPPTQTSADASLRSCLSSGQCSPAPCLHACSKYRMCFSFRRLPGGACRGFRAQRCAMPAAEFARWCPRGLSMGLQPFRSLLDSCCEAC